MSNNSSICCRVGHVQEAWSNWTAPITEDTGEASELGAAGDAINIPDAPVRLQLNPVVRQWNYTHPRLQVQDVLLSFYSH